jgi:hypothetical protein
MTHNSWRDAPKPSHADVLKDALQPGSKNKRPVVEIGRGQKILSSSGNDPQGRSLGLPRSSLLTDDFAGGPSYSEHSLDGAQGKRPKVRTNDRVGLPNMRAAGPV